MLFKSLILTLAFISRAIICDEDVEGSNKNVGVKSSLPELKSRPGHECYVEAMSLLKKINAAEKHNLGPESKRKKGADFPILPSAYRVIKKLFISKSEVEVGSKINSGTDTRRVVKLLIEAAEKDHPKAIFSLVQIFLFSPYGHPRDAKKAKAYLEQLVRLNGNAEGHHLLGHFYATGLDGNEPDQAMAILHHTFAARAGHPGSQMVLGFRYLNGIGTSKSCLEGLNFYQQVAQTAIEKFNSGPPGGLDPPRSPVRISDFDGGVFSEKFKLSRGKGRDAAKQIINEKVEYLEEFSKGNLRNSYVLGRFYYFRYKIQARYLGKAKFYLQRSEEILGALGPSTEWEKGYNATVAEAYSFLGSLYLRGEIFGPSNKTALAYFKKSADHEYAEGQYWLGTMLYDMESSKKEGIIYLTQAASNDHPEAHASLGLHYLHIDWIDEAQKHLKHAALKGNTLANYHLARFFTEGTHTFESCETAASRYKLVAEEWRWNLDYTTQAFVHHDRGAIETAAVYYLLAAEMGIEVAQANLAWLIDLKIYSMPTISRAAASNSSVLPNYRMALTYWTRSANQGNGESRIMQCDYHYYGLASSSPSLRDFKKAASCYQHAADKLNISRAMWNMGWMYENGVGLPLDLHLAKKYYKKALAKDPSAYFPIHLSLLFLNSKLVLKWSGVLPYLSLALEFSMDGYNLNILRSILILALSMFVTWLFYRRQLFNGLNPTASEI